jgi:hypothetical protein
MRLCLSCGGAYRRKKISCGGKLRPERKTLQLSCPRGKPQTQCSSGAGSFPLPIARRRPDFSPGRAEDASDFTSGERRADVQQLLKGQSENFKQVFAVHSFGLIDALIDYLHPNFSCHCPFNKEAKGFNEV